MWGGEICSDQFSRARLVSGAWSSPVLALVSTRKKHYLGRGRSCLRPRAAAGEQILCSPSYALSSRCHLYCRPSSACKLCPCCSDGFSILPSSAEMHLGISEAIWIRSLLKATGSTSCSKCAFLAGGSTPKTQVLPCLHLLMHYPLLHRCWCRNQTGTESLMVLSVSHS